jgi:hypothetical protein
VNRSSGIRLAAAVRFAEFGMKMCIADIGDDALKTAEAKMSAASPRHLVRAKPHLGSELRRSSRFTADAIPLPHSSKIRGFKDILTGYIVEAS